MMDSGTEGDMQATDVREEKLKETGGSGGPKRHVLVGRVSSKSPKAP